MAGPGGVRYCLRAGRSPYAADPAAGPCDLSAPSGYVCPQGLRAVVWPTWPQSHPGPHAPWATSGQYAATAGSRTAASVPSAWMGCAATAGRVAALAPDLAQRRAPRVPQIPASSRWAAAWAHGASGWMTTACTGRTAAGGTLTAGGCWLGRKASGRQRILSMRGSRQPHKKWDPIFRLCPFLRRSI